MNITDIRIRNTYQSERLRAIVSVTFDDALAVHDIRVVQGQERLFVAMPNRRDKNGKCRDIVHPITSEARAEIESQVFAASETYMHDSARICEAFNPA